MKLIYRISWFIKNGEDRKRRRGDAETGVNEFETLEKLSIEEKEQSGAESLESDSRGLENLILPDIWKKQNESKNTFQNLTKLNISKEKNESENERENVTKRNISEEKDDNKTTHQNITKYNISENSTGNKEGIAEYENLTKPDISEENPPQLKNNATHESRPENRRKTEMIKDDLSDIADLLFTFPGK